MPVMRLRSGNRKLPPLPLSLDSVATTDPRRWAIVFTLARHKKRWTYLTLAAHAGVSERTVTSACTTGHCTAHTALKLCTVLGLHLPQPSHILTASEAQHGRHATS